MYPLSPIADLFEEVLVTCTGYGCNSIGPVAFSFTFGAVHKAYSK